MRADTRAPMIADTQKGAYFEDSSDIIIEGMQIIMTAIDIATPLLNVVTAEITGESISPPTRIGFLKNKFPTLTVSRRLILRTEARFMREPKKVSVFASFGRFRFSCNANPP